MLIPTALVNKTQVNKFEESNSLGWPSIFCVGIQNCFENDGRQIKVANISIII